jgi:hypothetical protein
MMDEMGSLLALNNLPGHISYVLIAISYWLTDIFWLRVVAVVGLSFEILYFWYAGGDLRTGIGWDTIFILINLYQLAHLVKERLSLRLPEADRDLLRGALTGLSDAQIAHLLDAGDFRDLADGTTLATENEALETIYVICAGGARVMVGGREVSRLEKGSFVGEAAFLTGKPATATVIADGEMRALAFGGEKLRQFFDRDGEVAGLIYQLLGRELAGKIKVSNALLAGAGVWGAPEPAAAGGG